MQNADPTPVNAVADRLVARALAQRTAEYADEVQRLLDAGLAVMRDCGTTSRPRVADIVAAAGLSNDAFYRHFASKDALITALLEDGTDKLCGYLSHQMAKEPTPAGQVRRWVQGVMSQADEEVAATTRAVLWNAGSVGDGTAAGRHFASTPLAALLEDPLALLGSTDPARDASLVAHAALGTLSDHLFRRTRPSVKDVEHLVDFFLAAVTAGSDARRE